LSYQASTFTAPSGVRRVEARSTTAVEPEPRLGITQRESDVLRAIVDGLNNRAVAEKLFISEDTVKTHVRSIFRNLSVTDRSQAVALALREGIFK
jgi:DNA-binding NarL/FixJ family response regulator